MREKLVSFFKEKELLVSPEALDALLKKDDPLGTAKEIAEKTDKLVIEPSDIATEPEVVVERSSYRPEAKDIEARVREFDDYNVTGKSTSNGDVGDFVDLFRDRFERLSSILKDRGETIKDIETLRKKGGEARVIGMVNSIRTTKNGHRLLTLEDLTGTLSVLILERDKPLIRETYNVVPDEVVAVDGKLSKELFIAKSLLYPEIPAREPHRTEEDIYLAMLSDTHVGSKLFMEKNFQKFLNWINGKEGNEKHRELAGKVKYVTIAGDIVDGVGIYPGQEDELETEDIFQQYKKAGELLSQIPDHIEMIAIPGNHDATRVAEPQPAVSKDIMGEIVDLPNFRCLANPGYVSLHGIEVLMYHGASIHSMVPHMVNITYEKPEKAISEWLKRRHLHPVYGEKPPICPEKRDYMVIERVPDVVHVGDVHKNGYVNHRSVVGVNSGTWQAITPYQVKQGHNPTPCILPLLNMRTGKLSLMHFEEGIA